MNAVALIVALVALIAMGLSASMMTAAEIKSFLSLS